MPDTKVIVWYAKGSGGFYLNYDSIPEHIKKLGLTPLGEIIQEVVETK